MSLLAQLRQFYNKIVYPFTLRSLVFTLCGTLMKLHPGAGNFI